MATKYGHKADKTKVEVVGMGDFAVIKGVTTGNVASFDNAEFFITLAQVQAVLDITSFSQIHVLSIRTGFDSTRIRLIPFWVHEYNQGTYGNVTTEVKISEGELYIALENQSAESSQKLYFSLLIMKTSDIASINVTD